MYDFLALCQPNADNLNLTLDPRRKEILYESRIL
jgi:hypothetical protein